jgi:hypothetical protein
MEAEIQLPLGRDLRRRKAEITQSVAAPESIRRLVKLVGSIAPLASAVLHNKEFDANAMRVITVSATVTEAACVDCSVTLHTLNSRLIRDPDT